MKTTEDSHVLYQGFLIKSPPEEKSKDSSRWKRRYFRLYSNKMLAYFKDDKKKSYMKQPIDLSMCLSIDAKLVFKKWDYVFSINTRHRTYYLVAEDEYVMKKWLKAICDLCSFKEDPASSTEAIIRFPNNGNVTSFRPPRASPIEKTPLSHRLSNSNATISTKDITNPQGTYMLLETQSSLAAAAERESTSSEVASYDILPPATACGSQQSPQSAVNGQLISSNRPGSINNDASTSGTPCYDFVPSHQVISTHSEHDVNDSTATTLYDMLPPRQASPSPSQVGGSIMSTPSRNAKLLGARDEGPTSCYDILPPRQPTEAPPRPAKSIKHLNMQSQEIARAENDVKSEDNCSSCYDVLPPPSPKTLAYGRSTFVKDKNCNENPFRSDDSSAMNVGDVYDIRPLPAAPPRPPKPPVSPSTTITKDEQTKNAIIRSSREFEPSQYDILPPRQDHVRTSLRSRTPSPGKGRRFSDDAVFGGRVNLVEPSTSEESCYDILPPRTPVGRGSHVSISSNISSISDETDHPCYDTVPSHSLSQLPAEERASLLDPSAPRTETRPHSDIALGKEKREEAAASYGLVPPSRPPRSRQKQSIKRVMSVPLAQSETLMGFSERKAQRAPAPRDGYVDMGSKLPIDTQHYQFVPPSQETRLDSHSSYNMLPAPVFAGSNDNYVHMSEPIIPKSASGKSLPPLPCQTYQGVEAIPLLKSTETINDNPSDSIYDCLPAKPNEANSRTYPASENVYLPEPQLKAEDVYSGDDAIYDVLPSPQSQGNHAPPMIDRTLKPKLQSRTATDSPDLVMTAPVVNRNIKPALKVNQDTDQLSKLAEEEVEQIQLTPPTRPHSPGNAEEALYDIVPAAKSKVAPTTLAPVDSSYVNISSAGVVEGTEPVSESKSKEQPKHSYINHRVGRSSPSSTSDSGLEERKLSASSLQYSDVVFDDKNGSRVTPPPISTRDCVYTTIDANATRAVSEARDAIGP